MTISHVESATVLVLPIRIYGTRLLPLAVEVLRVFEVSAVTDVARRKHIEALVEGRTLAVVASEYLLVERAWFTTALTADPHTCRGADGFDTSLEFGTVH